MFYETRRAGFSMRGHGAFGTRKWVWFLCLHFPINPLLGLPALLSWTNPSDHLKLFDISTVIRKYGVMKTTLVLPDEIFRQAKARAALKGQSFGKFLEQGLRRVLDDTDTDASSKASAWVRDLPPVPPAAAAELEQVVSAADFRQVDKSMW